MSGPKPLVLPLHHSPCRDILYQRTLILHSSCKICYTISMLSGLLKRFILFLLILIGLVTLVFAVRKAFMLYQNPESEVNSTATSNLECETNEDCGPSESCVFTDTCPPCSEDSPDFPDNCTCHRQSRCVANPQ